MKQSTVMKNSTWKKFFLPLLVAATAMLGTGLTSCNSDEPSNSGLPQYFNIVTLKSASTTSGMTFTYRSGATTPLITLTTNLVFPDEYGIKPGKRVLIGYNLPAGQSEEMSGPIELINFRQVYNDTVRTATPQVVAGWMAAPMQSTQVWRTGNYINAYSIIPASNTNTIHLYADPTTIRDGVAQMYLTLNNISATPMEQVDLYASYHLGSFLTKYPDVHTLVIHVCGAYDQQSEVTLRDIHLLPGE